MAERAVEEPESGPSPPGSRPSCRSVDRRSGGGPPRSPAGGTRRSRNRPGKRSESRIWARAALWGRRAWTRAMPVATVRLVVAARSSDAWEMTSRWMASGIQRLRQPRPPARRRSPRPLAPAGHPAASSAHPRPRAASQRRPAAVHQQVLPGHERTRRTRQEEQGSVEVLKSPQPTERCLAGDPVVGLRVVVHPGAHAS